LQHAKALDLNVSHSLIIRFESKKYNFSVELDFRLVQLKKKRRGLVNG